jgi:hypothetical protein
MSASPLGALSAKRKVILLVATAEREPMPFLRAEML